jgi:putative addiction module killer protein
VAPRIKKLRDNVAVARIQVRIRRVALGNLGDTKAVGGGVSELRIDYGPGYRVYYTRQGDTIVVLLIGGDKKTQSADILRAQELVKLLEDDQ